MKRMSIEAGDTISIMSESGRDTLCIVLEDKLCEDNSIRMNMIVRGNLDVRLSETVTILNVYAPYGKRIVVKPDGDTLGYSGILLEDYVKPYFLRQFRPVTEGDSFVVSKENEPHIKFKVVRTDPPQGCIVHDDETTISYINPINSDEDSVSSSDDSPGCGINEMKQLLCGSNRPLIIDVYRNAGWLRKPFQQKMSSDQEEEHTSSGKDEKNTKSYLEVSFDSIDNERNREPFFSSESLSTVSISNILLSSILSTHFIISLSHSLFFAA